MIQRSWFDRVGTLVGMIFILLGAMAFIESGNGDVHSIQFTILICTFISIIFPLMRSFLINSLGYALYFFLLLRLLLDTSYLVYFLIILILSLVIFFFCGMLEVTGMFLKGFTLTWWLFVTYSLFQSNLPSIYVVQYLGIAQFEYALDYWKHIFILALFYKIVVKSTMKTSIIDVTHKQKHGFHTKPKYYMDMKKQKSPINAVLNEQSIDFKTAHPILKELYMQGVLKQENFSFYLNLDEKALFKELLTNQYITEDDINKYIGHEEVQLSDNQYKSVLKKELIQEESSMQNINIEQYKCNRCGMDICQCCKICKERSSTCKCCKTCKKYPCDCCSYCHKSPCECCSICGEPKQWCKCLS
jgi:hypothetical protein